MAKKDEQETPAAVKAAAAKKQAPEVGEEKKEPTNRFDHKTKKVVPL